MLYIVATPIGNLQDITLRALSTLKDVDKIYCEDTRQTRRLLTAFAITKLIDSYHHHSSPAKLEQIINELTEGKNIAYVTDAGTPGLADPGGMLVETARANEIEICPIPGVSAVTTLLSVAGLPTNSFVFAGFLPTKKGRQTFIKKILGNDSPTIIFETAPRLRKFLRELVELGGAERQLVVGRELTKKFEQVVVGMAEQISEQLPPVLKGELVLLLAPASVTR